MNFTGFGNYIKTQHSWFDSFLRLWDWILCSFTPTVRRTTIPYSQARVVNFRDDLAWVRWTCFMSPLLTRVSNSNHDQVHPSRWLWRRPSVTPCISLHGGPVDPGMHTYIANHLRLSKFLASPRIIANIASLWSAWICLCYVSVDRVFLVDVLMTCSVCHGKC